MPDIELPMNTAHHHAANAEDHVGNGLLLPAIEEHIKAAEAYTAAVNRSNDESAKRTLRMLSQEHRKSAQDLERRAEKLRAEGKDPSQPQRPEFAPPMSPAQDNFPRPSSPRSHLARPAAPHRMMDSQVTVEESFMVLAGQKSDPGDAFNQFWNIMQGMLDNLSQPVAFATAPLNETDAKPSRSKPLKRDSSLSSDTDIDDPMMSRLTKKLGIASIRKGKRPVQSPLQQSSMAQSSDDEFDDGDELSESFFLIPSGAQPARSLQQENAALKEEVISLRKRLEATEKVLQLRKEQDLQLRDSIYMAQREAQRMGASFRVGGQEGRSPLAGFNTAREAQYARRVKELEDELKTARVEIDRVSSDNTRHRERWAKVKESARKKKELKAAAGASKDVMREKIVEEPELEDAEDGQPTIS